MRVDVFADKFVFLNIDFAARPLSELASGLERELRSEFPILTCWRGSSGRHRQTAAHPTPGTIINRNWKIVIENCLEC
jgi:hypothetical protein